MRTPHLAGLALAALGLTIPGVAAASSNYPATIQSHLSLSYAPACALCHQDGVTGMGTVTTPFGAAMRARGLVSQNTGALTAALDQMLTDKVDSDGDGVIDIDELVAGTDPNGGLSGGGSSAAPPLEYGCAASIAPGGAASGAPGSAWGLSLVLGLGAVVAVRRRRAALGLVAAGAAALSLAACYDVSYVTSDVCSSGLKWTGGDSGSPDMNPGKACIDCHSSGEGPKFNFAGTLYAQSHDEDTCLGVQTTSGGTPYIVITGADGKSIKMDPNDAGNFYSSLQLAKPYTAMVVLGDKKSVMATPQTSGDCNSCHTKNGKSGAPGRITLP